MLYFPFMQTDIEGKSNREDPKEENQKGGWSDKQISG